MKNERLGGESSEESYPEILYESSEDQDATPRKSLSKASWPHKPGGPDIFIQIREKNRYDRLNDHPNLFTSFIRIYYGFTDFCLLTISSSAFEIVVLGVILLNIIAMALEDPMSMQQDPAGLPALSKQLGRGVRTNSEALFGVIAKRRGHGSRSPLASSCRAMS